MKAKQMESSEKLDIIREILGWGCADPVDQVYMIQSFLLNWTDAERIHELTDAFERR